MSRPQTRVKGEFKKVRQDLKRKQEEYDWEEFLEEKDLLMGMYWLDEGFGKR